MFKMLFGAAVVVALVGYGVITTDDVQTAGDEVRQGVNTLLQKGVDATADTTWEELQAKTLKELKAAE